MVTGYEAVYRTALARTGLLDEHAVLRRIAEPA